MKVTVVGAGNVGATCANVLASREVANEVVLLTSKMDLQKAKPWIFGKPLPLICMIHGPWGVRTITREPQDLKWWSSPAGFLESRG